MDSGSSCSSVFFVVRPPLAYNLLSLTLSISGTLLNRLDGVMSDAARLVLQLQYRDHVIDPGSTSLARCLLLTCYLLVTCSLCGPRAQGPDIVPCRFSPVFIESVFEGVRCLRLNHSIWKIVPMIHNSL